MRLYGSNSVIHFRSFRTSGPAYPNGLPFRTNQDGLDNPSTTHFRSVVDARRSHILGKISSEKCNRLHLHAVSHAPTSAVHKVVRSRPLTINSFRLAPPDFFSENRHANPNTDVGIFLGWATFPPTFDAAVGTGFVTATDLVTTRTPEPSSLLLLAGGLACLSGLRRKRIE